jgi:hypothetical protein
VGIIVSGLCTPASPCPSLEEAVRVISASKPA